MRHIKLTFIPLLLASTLHAEPSARSSPDSRPDPTLHVGDMAPPLKVDKWLKGNPVTSLTDGKIHVVEFWATWCGPCRVGMPHLSNLAKKYGDKLSIVSIDVRENRNDTDKSQDNTDRVNAFVTRAKDMMDYIVATDGVAGGMEETWLKPARIDGIPAAVVVNTTGKIVWIGHPMLGLEEVLDHLFANTLTPATTAEIDAKYAASTKQFQPLNAKILAALAEKRFEDAATLNDQAVAAAPHQISLWAKRRYVILAHTDPAALAAYKKELFTTYGNAPAILLDVAQVAMDETALAPAAPDYLLAIQLQERAFSYIAPHYTQMPSLAAAYAKSGNYPKAIELLEAALEAMTAAPIQNPIMIARHQKILAEYKAATPAKVGG